MLEVIGLGIKLAILILMSALGLLPLAWFLASCKRILLNDLVMMISAPYLCLLVILGISQGLLSLSHDLNGLPFFFRMILTALRDGGISLR